MNQQNNKIFVFSYCLFYFLVCVALKHSPSKRKSLSRVAQRSTEADSDSSHRKCFVYK